MFASKVDILDETTNVKVIKKTLRATVAEMFPKVFIENKIDSLLSSKS